MPEVLYEHEGHRVLFCDTINITDASETIAKACSLAHQAEMRVSQPNVAGCGFRGGPCLALSPGLEMPSSEAQLEIVSAIWLWGPECGGWSGGLVVKLLATAQRPRGWEAKPLRVRRLVLPAPAGSPSGISCVSQGPESIFVSLAFHADLTLVAALTGCFLPST